VAPVDQVAGGDDRLALGGQPGKHERDPGAQVMRDHLGAAQAGRAVHDRHAAVELDLRCHLVQFADQRVPPVEDRLADVA